MERFGFLSFGHHGPDGCAALGVGWGSPEPAHHGWEAFGYVGSGRAPGHARAQTTSASSTASVPPSGAPAPTSRIASSSSS